VTISVVCCIASSRYLKRKVDLVEEWKMSILAETKRVARLLADNNAKVVFAESCTGGLVSGALTKVPGISDYHCGGVVVYRNETKSEYLGIPQSTLNDPGPVSREVAALMAERVLEKTPEADVAAAVTGHLGPNAPPELDGLIFMSVAERSSGKQRVKTTVKRMRCPEGTSRNTRQRQVVEAVLALLAETLEGRMKRKRSS
jgi:nicotinamide-nucleotide amidase